MKRFGELAAQAGFWTIVLCAAISTVVLVRREVAAAGRHVDGGATMQVGTGGTAAQVSVDNWREVATAGHRFGPDTALVTVVEFADFECPFCRRYNEDVIATLRAKYPGTVAVVFRHWPLTRIHRFAYPAARAAECAAAQGRFEQFHDLLFAKQDSLGLKSFDQFAVEAGLRDVKAFSRCNSVPSSVAVVDADAAAAIALGAHGTPTVLVNGTRFKDPPSFSTLDSIAQRAMQRGQ